MILPVTLALVAIAGIAAAWAVVRAEQAVQLQEALDAVHRARLAAEEGVHGILVQIERDGSLPFDQAGQMEMRPEVQVIRWTGERESASVVVTAWDESGKVNLNFANPRLLEELPGFDDSVVEALHVHRVREGDWISVWDLVGPVPETSLQAVVTAWGPPSLRTADPLALEQTVIQWGVGTLEARRIAEELAVIQERISRVSGEIDDDEWRLLGSVDGVPDALPSMGRLTWETIRSRVSVEGTVNVNTAPAEVLRALARVTGLPESAVVFLERSRQNALFRNLSELSNQLAGYEEAAVERFLAHVSTATTLVGVRSTAQVAGWSVTIHTVLWLPGNDFKESQTGRGATTILEWVETS